MRDLMLLWLLSACSDDPEPADTDVPSDPGIPVLGGNTHSTDGVRIRELRSADLDDPADLAFHRDHPELLLVTNRGDDSIVVFDTSEPHPEGDLRKGDASQHFLANPAGIAFGDHGWFATIHDEDEKTQSSTPADFMGPTLWTADMDEFDGGWASHYDMLHNSPSGVGIAWERGNAYWIFDGWHASLTRYDFHGDHGPGGDDHADGEVARYVEGEVSHMEGVASNLAFDRVSQLLYVADSGNGRVAALDIGSGERGSRITPNYDGSDQYRVDGAEISTIVSTADVADLVVPSGLDLHDGKLFVGDNETGTIFAFTPEGELLDWLDLGLRPGALQGLTVDGNGDLWVVDSVEERVLQISPR